MKKFLKNSKKAAGVLFAALFENIGKKLNHLDKLKNKKNSDNKNVELNVPESITW